MQTITMVGKDSNPIGVFDFGVGGLTIVRELKRILPNEQIIFLGDEENSPFSRKFIQEEELARCAISYMRFLEKHHIKLAVIGCNLMSAYAVRELEKKFSIPIVGLVESTLEEIYNRVEKPEVAQIAVFTTPVSAGIKLYQKIMKEKMPEAQVFEIGCPDLLDIIAKNQANTEEADVAVAQYAAMVPKTISAALLTCTRFPVLMNSFQRALPGIPVIDPAVGSAKRTKKILEKMGLLSKRRRGIDSYFSSGDKNVFKKNVQEIMGEIECEINSTHIAIM